MYLSILVAALIVFVLVMTMTKDVVEGYMDRKTRTRTSTILKKEARKGKNNALTKLTSSKRRKWRKMKARKKLNSIKVELLKLEDDFDKERNQEPDTIKKHIQNSIYYEKEANYIYNTKYLSIKKKVKKLKKLRDSAMKNLKKAKLSFFILESRMKLRENEFKQRIKNILNKLNKRIIKIHISESDVLDFKSSAESLRSRIINHFDAIKKEMNGHILYIENLTSVVEDDLYDKAAAKADASSQSTETKTLKKANSP